MSLSGVIVFLQFALFLTIGFLLSFYYQGTPMPQDQAFSAFIINRVPSGISGLIIAAIIAAAMSTLSSSVNSLASSSIVDLLKNRFQSVSQLSLSRFISVLWGILLTLTAIILIDADKDFNKSVVELGLKIASVTYGPLLGIFIVGVLNKKVDWTSIVISLLSTLCLMAFLVFKTTLTWTLFTLIGSVFFIALIFVLTKFRKTHG